MIGRNLLILSLFFVACGPGTSGNSNDGGETCMSGTTRCQGATFQTCENSFFRDSETCPGVCDPRLGCVECRSDSPTICVGNKIHACTSDGVIGQLLEICEFSDCVNGKCSDDCADENAKLIYVVDEQYRLHSFDPSTSAFTLIGSIDCPAGPSWPDWSALGAATPFSMSVDRNSRAWVLYTSGEIFSVSTADASCVPTNFVAGQNGFQLFGLGFSSNSAGSSDETLFVAGGAVNATTANLGKVDPSSLSLTSIGALPAGEYSPELTGTGNGELFGYYPGASSTTIAKINKETGAWEDSWNLLPLGGTVSAWAFAHWGGKFYIFVTTSNGVTNNAQVYEFNPAGQGYNRILDNTGRVVVGAGVSTCAPVIVN